MRYLKFTISNYRGITEPLIISLERSGLIPIIGINESGKTTILHALFAFDENNDDVMDGQRHLKDTRNLYSTNPQAATIQACIEVSKAEITKVLAALQEDDPDSQEWCARIKNKKKLPSQILITRKLETLEYEIDTPELDDSKFGSMFASRLIRRAPFILFFDDFRDKVDEKVEIPAVETRLTGWAAILQRLFKQTDNKLSVFHLASMEVRQRKSVLAKVQRRLNNTLTREWANFRLDDRDALEISIDFESSSDVAGKVKHYIKMDVVETDSRGDKHYFFISDRSKGFFWFFNFVMKLEFNPKVVSDDGHDTIYLLDEPGSYLHASAQSKLCRKLRTLSERSRVIYCTHSHYLLDPESIPLSTIRVAERDANVSSPVK